MQITTVGSYTITLGTLIALLVLVAVFVLAIIHSLDNTLALLIGGVALARLL